jgi:hypothetical protein
VQTLRNENEYITSGVHKFSKICRNHLKILGAIWLTYSKFHFGNLKLLGAVVRNVFAQAIWRLGFFIPALCLYQYVICVEIKYNGLQVSGSDSDKWET